MAMPWFPCYPSDLLGSLRWQMMTPEERGAYWQLLCLCYQSANGKIMAPLYLLSRMSGIDLEQHPLVLEAFQQDEDGAWFNERAYSEWLKRQEVSEKRTEAGVKGAANRWQKHRQTDGKPMANANTSTSTSTSRVRANNQEKDSLALSRAKSAEGFDEFWHAYPKKRSKEAALKAWKKLKPGKQLKDQIIEAVNRQAKDPDWHRENGQYIPYPASWLNAGGWQDEVTVLPERDSGPLPF
jgi:uncharacterized protein YdaU (DUF1376 family)